jgi:hypothetical protein
VRRPIGVSVELNHRPLESSLSLDRNKICVETCAVKKEKETTLSPSPDIRGIINDWHWELIGRIRSRGLLLIRNPSWARGLFSFRFPRIDAVNLVGGYNHFPGCCGTWCVVVCGEKDRLNSKSIARNRATTRNSTKLSNDFEEDAVHLTQYPRVRRGVSSTQPSRAEVGVELGC